MLYCKKCGVQINGSQNLCPLCQGDLTGSPLPKNIFPDVKPQKDMLSLAIRIIGFVSVVATLICLIVNYSINDEWLGWWIYVAAGFFTFWIPFGMIIRTRHNLYKCIVWATTICSVEAFLWDFFTGNLGWALNFFLPIACTCAMLALATIARIQHLQIAQYLAYLVINTLLGILPFLFLVFGIVTITFPSLICSAIAIIILVALLIFKGKDFKTELGRRLHY